MSQKICKKCNRTHKNKHVYCSKCYHIFRAWLAETDLEINSMVSAFCSREPHFQEPSPRRNNDRPKQYIQGGVRILPCPTAE